MKEVITFEVNANQSQLIQDFLKSKKIDYQLTPKVDIFANYDQAINNSKRDQELRLWDNVDLDENLNNDGE